MIETTDILDALKRDLHKQFPDRILYINDTPEKFKRPSLLLSFLTNSIKSLNLSTRQVTAYFTITCFEPEDDRKNPQIPELLTIQQAVLHLFRAGVLAVKDRMLPISASSGGTDRTTAFVDLQLTFCDSKELPKEHYDPMQTVKTNIKPKGLK